MATADRRRRRDRAPAVSRSRHHREPERVGRRSRRSRAFVYQGDHLAVFAPAPPVLRSAVRGLRHAVVGRTTGHIPSVDEAKERLEFLRRHGPSPWAFTFAHREPPLLGRRASTSTMPTRQQLISELNADIMATHAEGSHFWGLTAEDVSAGPRRVPRAAPRRRPGGLRRGAQARADDVAELKRMFVQPVGAEQEARRGARRQRSSARPAPSA